MAHFIRCAATVQKGQEVEKMKQLNASTYKGREIIRRATRDEGDTLSHVYNKWSPKKEEAYYLCYREYLKTKNHDKFAICSHDTFGFTCSWTGTKDGERIIRYETKDNSYLVWLER